jgi:hypothetical protein
MSMQKANKLMNSQESMDGSDEMMLPEDMEYKPTKINNGIIQGYRPPSISAGY